MALALGIGLGLPFKSLDGPSVPSPLGAISLVSVAANSTIGGDDSGSIIGSSALVGVIDTSGNQTAIEFDAVTGALISSHVLFGPVTVDDHNSWENIVAADGSRVAAACDHNQAATVSISRSSTGSAGGFAAPYNITASNKTTYPSLFLHVPTGNLFLIYRVNQVSWEICRSTNNGVSFTVLGVFVNSGGDQMYVKADFLDADRLLLISYVNPAVGATYVKSATLNLSTGNLVSGSGTLSNIYGATQSALSDWSTIYTDPDTGLPAVTNVQGAGPSMFTMTRLRADQQFAEYYCGELTGASLFTDTDWTFTKLCDGGYGVGDSNPTYPNYLRPGKMSISQSPGRANPQIHMGRQFWGVSKLSTWDKIGGVWVPTAFYAEKALGLSDTVFRPTPMASDTVPFTYADGSYHGYTSWALTQKAAVITRRGSSAPVYSGPLTFTQPERQRLIIPMACDQPAVIKSLGGADAAQFIAFENALLFKSKIFGSPADANSDNVYDVDVTLRSLSGNETTVTLHVTVTHLQNTNTSLTKWNRDLANASTTWALTGLTASRNTANTLDPFGTNLATQYVDAASANTNHRTQQTLAAALLANTQYTYRVKLKAKASNFSMINFSDGTTQFGGVFDILRGDFVAPRSPTISGGTLDAWGVETLANSWFDCWVTATTGASIGTCTAFLNCKNWGGSLANEDGNTGYSIYAMDAMLALGTFPDFAVRTT